MFNRKVEEDTLRFIHMEDIQHVIMIPDTRRSFHKRFNANLSVILDSLRVLKIEEFGAVFLEVKPSHPQFEWVQTMSKNGKRTQIILLMYEVDVNLSAGWEVKNLGND